MDDKLELVAAVSLALRHGGDILREAEKSLGPEWATSLRSRLKTEIKNLDMRGFPSLEDEAVFYKLALDLLDGIYVMAGHKAHDD
jgi:hypothetical protein